MQYDMQYDEIQNPASTRAGLHRQKRFHWS